MNDRAISSGVGARLKHARLLKGINLVDLGKAVGLSEGYLSKIENNRSTPSLATLHKLVQSLDINMSSLFVSDEDAHSNIGIVRADARPKLETGHIRSGNQVVLERLIPSGPERLLQINIHVIAPSGGSLEQISHIGQEFGYVLCGSVELIVGTDTEILEQGDAFYFDSDLPHGYRNVGTDEARVLWVNTPPTF